MDDYGRSLRDGLSSSTEPEVSALRASIPSAWRVTQYGYEKFSITDERGTEIGFVHRHRDALLAAAAPELRHALRTVLAVTDLYRDVFGQKCLAEIDAVRPALAKASAIEARRAETQGGSVEDESAVPNGETPKGHRHD